MNTSTDSPDREPKRTKTQISQPFPHLPQDVIIDILSRLPVKSLLQFRCVSKSWLSLISNPLFVKTHLTTSYKADDYTHWRLILSSIRPHFDLKSCSLHSVLYNQSDNAVKLDYPLKNPYHSISIVGSCNGLVCIAIEKGYVFLWNPSTRKSKRLPNPAKKMLNECIIYGFGYVENIDDYKVVGIFCFVGSRGLYETEVKVYSLITDSWRRIGKFSHGIPLYDSGKYVNGTLHWAANGSSGLNFSWVIVSLDLAKETFGEIAQPSYADGAADLSLGVLEGCICVLCNFQGAQADLWVMKEYGIRDSWIKMSTIPYKMELGNFEYSIPLWISKIGEILVEFGGYLVLYNPNDGKFRLPEIHNMCICLEAATYVESLVSPNI